MRKGGGDRAQELAGGAAREDAAEEPQEPRYAALAQCAQADGIAFLRQAAAADRSLIRGKVFFNKASLQRELRTPLSVCPHIATRSACCGTPSRRGQLRPNPPRTAVVRRPRAALGGPEATPLTRPLTSPLSRRGEFAALCASRPAFRFVNFGTQPKLWMSEIYVCPKFTCVRNLRVSEIYVYGT